MTRDFLCATTGGEFWLACELAKPSLYMPRFSQKFSTKVRILYLAIRNMKGHWQSVGARSTLKSKIPNS